MAIKLSEAKALEQQSFITKIIVDYPTVEAIAANVQSLIKEYSDYTNRASIKFLICEAIKHYQYEYIRNANGEYSTVLLMFYSKILDAILTENFDALNDLLQNRPQEG